MRPDQITALTQLDLEYSQNLSSVSTPQEFETFLHAWEYFLDDETRQLTGADWPKLRNLIADCRQENCNLNGVHGPAIALAMPYKISKISLLANYFGTTWGYAYLELRKAGSIDF